MTTATLYAAYSSSMDADLPTTATATSTYFTTGHFSTPQTKRGLLQFDISSIPADATINSATLKLTVSTNFLGTSHTIDIYRLRRRWLTQTNAGAAYILVSRASYNNYRQDVPSAWTTAGASDTTNDRDGTAIGSFSVTSSTSGQVSITLSASQFQEWVDGSFLNNGIILQASNETGTTLMRWLSEGNATAANRPQIVVDYTPVSRLLSDSIVAYWKMEEASGNLADASGNAHALAPTNTPTQVSGLISNAQHYVAASSQYHSNADAGVRMGNTDWTFTAWVKLTDKNEYYTVSANENGIGDETGWSLFYHKQSVLDYFVWQLYGTTGGGGDNPIMDVIGYKGGNPSAGAWVFLACRHDSVRHLAQLFVNGNNPDDTGAHNAVNGDAFMTYPGTFVATAGNFYIGGRVVNGPSPGGYMNGDIDEVGLWNRWLSNDEIATLYNSGYGSQPTFASVFRRTLNMRSASRGVTE